VNYNRSVVDRNSPEAQTVGEGPVWVFSNGQVVEGRWKRDDIQFPIQYLNAQGDPIALQPGNTWIELADNAEVNEGRVVVLPATPPVP
jgi:hypothetical protein